MQAPPTESNPASSVASRPHTLLKTVSSPTALSAQLASTPTSAPSPTTTPTGGITARVVQGSRQPPVHFRLSQLSDSGAESGDADDQARLIRTPSARSHKFIIIPSQAPQFGNGGTPTAGASGKFRQTISAASLGALGGGGGGAVQKRAIAARPVSTVSSSHARGLALVAPEEASAIDAANSSSDTAGAPRESDGSAQLEVARETQTSAAPGVVFTIEDYEEAEQAAPVAGASIAAQQPALEQTKTQQPAISSINTTTNATTAAADTAPIHTAIAPIPNTPGGLPTLSMGLRGRNDRSNASTRSVVSAYMPSQHELDAQYQPHHPYHQPIPPMPPTPGSETGYGKDWSASASYIYRDTAANQIYSDVTSVRSLASIGIGSTDGHKLVIRRVPHTPTELFTLMQPPPVSPAPGGVGDDDDDSFMDMSDETAYLKPRRQHWGSKMQFVLACIGYSVGLGNVWRFPYMCYKSGGGVFLVPYCIILIICSIPLLFMELSVGQYTGRGPIGALGQLCPLFKGAGLASVVVSFLMSTYYSVIIGYSIYYFFTAFKPIMPWVDCNNRWNTPDCWVPQRVEGNSTAPPTSRTPSEEFFENKVLQISRGIEFPGEMRWELFACLICAWLMVYFATWKSIKSSAKVRYFTATFPFVLIIILLGRAVTLDGADEGLRYFFRPNWSELKNANVWINAASQNFNSLGITFGSMISFASYNKYNNNIVRDTISVSVVNVLTSLLVGVFAFATLGNLALEQNTNVRDVISDGPGMIFVVYPQAMAKMPYAQLWAVMFFFMLLCLGLNSQFAIVEVVVTSIQDGFPNWIKRHLGYHEIVVLIVCVISFLFGLPNLIQGGIYYFQLMDHYAASVSIIFLAFCQMVAIAWFYGTGRLSKNVKQMTGKAPTFYLKSCWVVLGPCLLFAIWILSLVNYQEPTYHNGRYKYPEWAYGIGWMFTSLSLVCIPGMAILSLVRSTGDTFWERISNALHPHIYECAICGEHHCEHDYPEQEQYMLAQEMPGLQGMYRPNEQLKSFGGGTATGYQPGYAPTQQFQPQSATSPPPQQQVDITYEKSNAPAQQAQSSPTMQQKQPQHEQPSSSAPTTTR